MNSQEEDVRAARYADLFEKGHEHDSNCAYCPICATIAIVRNTKPEVLDHLASAAREMVIAAGILLEEAEHIVSSKTTTPSREESGSSKVRRIDVT